MELSKNFGKMPWQRKRYLVEGDADGVYAGLSYAFRSLPKAQQALKDRCVDCVLENQQLALIGQANQPSIWHLRDLETDTILKSFEAGAYKPVSAERAVRNLARAVGYRV